MDYRDWEPVYKKILSDFNFNQELDFTSAKLLDEMLQHKKIVPIEKLKSMISGKEIFIFGAGPSLEKSIHRYKNKYQNKLKIAVDGATTALLIEGVHPDIIVTDLDGDVGDQLQAHFGGCLMIIHAHGDNIEQIKRYVPKFEGEILGTTQTNPSQYDCLYNFGGFTDGDRAIHIAEHFNAKKINLIGFDFNDEIGKYSYMENKNKKVKLKKLRWCKKLIEDIDKQHKIEFL